MAGKTLTTTVSINGNIDASVQKAFDSMTKRLSAVQKASVQASGATDKLSAVIDMQSDQLEAAKKAYSDYILSGEKSRKKAQELEKNIKDLAKELGDNNSKLTNAQKAAEKLADGLEETRDSAKEAEGGFTVMKGAAAELVANGIMKITSACVEAVKSIYGLAESTREYREDMGKLETAFEAAGRSTDLATDTYKNFYSVLGEEDRSVEAVNHLAQFVETEKDMQKWTDICAGVWGTFGDSLPIEGLTEAANETAKVGEVTGVLADALNWAGVNQDDFQTYLDKCTTEQERAAYITEMLNSLYGEAADKYKENNASIIDARLANSDYTDSLAEIGEKIEPVTTAVQGGLNKILQKGLELINKVDLAGFAGKISTAFDRLAPILGTVMEQGMEIGGQLLQAIVPVLPPLLSLIGNLGGFLGDIIPIVARILAVIVPLVGSLIDGLAPAVMTVLNSLTPVISAVQSILEWLLPPLITTINALMPIIQYLAHLFSNVLGNAIAIIMPYIQHLIGYFQGIIDFIQNVFAGNWSAAWENIKSIFAHAFGAFVAIAKAPINTVIGMINSVVGAINSVGFKIPDWVPVIGGKDFSINIPEIPMLATGGFTEGVSIAGEKGTEAVISFDNRYRAQNLSYWAQAGRMLGADPADYAFGGYGGGSHIDFGGVTFAPNITVSGNADKESIMEAIEAEYPEFIDMLEEYLMQRSVTAYA
ncbi:MAG: hypothetical protein J6Q53_04440 [Oscillospiraceae bacterium]|nr:hypothetical protein [Oscillospiraceae bacterium]